MKLDNEWEDCAVSSILLEVITPFHFTKIIVTHLNILRENIRCCFIVNLCTVPQGSILWEYQLEHNYVHMQSYHHNRKSSFPSPKGLYFSKWPFLTGTLLVGGQHLLIETSHPRRNRQDFCLIAWYLYLKYAEMLACSNIFYVYV